MFLVLPAHFKFRPHNFVRSSLHQSPKEVFTAGIGKLPRNPNALHYRHSHGVKNPMLCCSKISLLTRACTDGGQAESFAAQEQSPVSDIQALRDNSSSSHDGYVPLFIRMLGLDNDTQDREQAVVALWKYSLGGKQCVDNIMKHHGSVNLVVNLLKSRSDSACEAAAGLLRVISSINIYREIVAGTSAIEEITCLLRHSSLSSDVKEQTICTLWNLSVDEKLSARIASSEVLSLIIKSLDDECIKVKEAAAGVLANLTLTQLNHKAIVEAGAIPKLAKLFTTDLEESKVIKKTARNALLELAKDQYNRILILEEGLVVVPLVGSEAYKSFRPSLYSWPSLPDGTKIEQQKSKVPSKYGASELLIGLNIDKNVDLEEAKMNAVVGRMQQQFLARIGAIEVADENNSDSNWSSSQSSTLLPWMDAVARLVLILGLNDVSAVAKAAETIADASINDHMRVAFKEAGAIMYLAELINHPNDTVRVSAVRALDRLSISNTVCQVMEAEGILPLLVNAVKQYRLENSHNLTSMILNILSRILDPNKEIKSKVSQKGQDITEHSSSADGNEEISSKFVSRPTVAGGNLFDSTFLSSLTNIMKTTPNLQRKAASVLEFITAIEPCVEKLVTAGIESGLEAVFQQKVLTGTEHDDTETGRTEAHILELEEAGLAVSAAAQLLTKLLDHDKFRETINSHHFMKLLHSILVSNIPLENKEWVAACLVKLSSLSSNQSSHLENPVHMEVTLYETIPRLIQQMKNSSYSEQVQEAAVLELNKIISEGVVDYSRAVASGGGIFPLVKLMGNGSDQAVEASLTILYNLSMDAENQPAIIAAGAVSVLRKLVLSERSEWVRALHLLRTLPT